MNNTYVVIENKLLTIGYYHIHIFDINGYTGLGAFCKTLQEIADYMKAYNITEYKYI